MGEYIKQATTIGRPAHMNKCLVGANEAGVIEAEWNFRMSSETGGGELTEPEAVGSPEADDPAAADAEAGAISSSPSRGVSRCLFRAESKVSSRASSRRTTLAVIQSGATTGAALRFHGCVGFLSSAIAGRALPAAHKMQN